MERWLVAVEYNGLVARVMDWAHVVLGSGLDRDVGEAGRGSGRECSEDVLEHGFVDGDVGFFVAEELEGDPEEMRDLAGDGGELAERVGGVGGVEGDEVVDSGSREPVGRGAPSSTVNFPWAAAEAVGLLQGLGQA